MDPVKAFEALSHKVRLAVVRLLVPFGRDGLPAGEIGTRLSIAPTALSFHLHRLSAAGLVRARRVGRHHYYAVDYDQLSALIRFLSDDCCVEAPEGCLPCCPSGAQETPDPPVAQKDSDKERPKVTQLGD